MAALALPLGLRACAEPLRIGSPSMEPTLRTGDHVLVAKRPRRPLRRGDVVAFRPPARWTVAPGPALRVKRVAALAGDSVRIKAGQVWTNGRPVAASSVRRYTGEAVSLEAVRGCDVVAASRQEGGRIVAVAPVEASACLHALGLREGAAPVRPATPYPDTAFVVPPGTFVALGDFPDASHDSRTLGPVPEAAVAGRVARILVSFNEATGTWRLRRFGQHIR